MTARYSSTSPWYATPMTPTFLDIWVPRPVPSDADDFAYSIQAQYNFRPDLLAFDIYGTSRLWWVFAQRNVDILIDPIYDFKTGTLIQLPKKTKLLTLLGLG
jgi:alpha-L-fucosidase